MWLDSLQEAPNHKLGTLVDYISIPADGVFHRALFDAQMTAKLWLELVSRIQLASGLDAVPLALISKLNKTPKKQVRKMLSQYQCTA